MSLNAAEVAWIADALDARLRGARVRAIRGEDSRPTRLWLRLRAGDGDSWLLVELDPRVARVWPSTPQAPAPASPSAFVMLLRKHLEGGAIEGVVPERGDRVLSVSISSATGAWELVISLRGRRADVMLVGDDGQRAGAMRGVGDDAGASPGHARDTALRAEWPAQATDEALAQLEQAFQEADAAGRLDDARRQALTRVDRELAALHRRLRHLDADTSRLGDAEAWRRRGELLQGARGAVARGADHALVVDWYADDAPTVRADLDAALSLEENIAACYARARKAERGRRAVAERQERTRSTVAALEAARADLEALDDPATIAEFVARLEREGTLPSRSRAVAGRAVAEARRLPFRRYRSSDGIEILVGRGGADNDRLTFQIGRAADLWFHAADVPGAHVLVVRGRDPRPVPPNTLREAALLAAHFSRAARERFAAVQWTERRHVRKPRGVPPGRVSVSGARSIDVRLDDPALAALLAAGEQ